MKESLLKLLESRRIVIPPMQRDYAHGRLNLHAESIRKAIVARLKSVLLDASSEHPMKMQLDYVFGKNRNDTFIPLDGQQRLTSLFLFYRYVIEATGNLEAYRETLAKFSYATRQSAREFCLALSENPILAQKEETMRIKGFSWFSEAWMGDPTVESMIVVLQEIHAQLKDADLESNFDMQRLEKCITFNCILMDEWMMPDSEYITMNSTNLALTPWENFKAALVGTFRDELSKVYKEKLDTTWTDAFFHYFKQQYDDRLFKFFYLHISNLQLVAGCCSSDGIASLPARDYSRPIPYTPFENFSPDSAPLSINDLKPLFDLLDRISQGNHLSSACLLIKTKLIHYADKPLALLSVSSRVELKDRIVFYACTCFFKYLTSNIDEILPHWMRVVWNIAENLDLKPDNSCKIMASFDRLAMLCLGHCITYKDFYEKLHLYVIPEGTESTFRSQLEEEKLKAFYFGDTVAEDIICEAEYFELCKGKLAVFLEDEQSGPSINVETLQRKLCQLKKFYDDVSSKDSRVDTIWRVYCTARNHYASGLATKNFEFPSAPSDWKRVINHRASKEPQYSVWRKICDNFIFADEPLECKIDSPDTFTNVLEQRKREIFSQYAQIWGWGSGWIRTRESGRTATSYYLDRYAELESALCMCINKGYQYRPLYRVDKQSDGTFMVTHNAQNKSHLVSLEQLQGTTYTSLQEYLNEVLPNILPAATP